jgi:formate/nitrite transporter FocA (FNT family)
VIEQGGSSRPTAREIYERVIVDARDELERPPSRLAFSGLFAGGTVSFSALAVAIALTMLPRADWAPLAASLLYPIGFVAVIIGRSQLFTENTLYPVALAFTERGHVRATARLWVVVFAANMAGALLLALFVTRTGALAAPVTDQLTALGTKMTAGSFAADFWSAVISGWILALIAWLVEAAEAAVGQILVVWALALLVGLGSFDHSVASTLEVFSATLEGSLSVPATLGWLGTAALGNVVGGVGIVAVLNYGQVKAESSG